MTNHKLQILLGSASPRRRALLAGLDLPFTAINIDADETYPAELQGGDIPYYISRAKARAYEAFAMLRALSGKTHQVYTAVTFCKGERLKVKGESMFTYSTIVDKTDVTFAELTDSEIRYYIDKYKPFDKAGAYGVQEWIWYIACTEMKGSYFNVMGFPVHGVYEYLKSHGVL